MAFISSPVLTPTMQRRTKFKFVSNMLRFYMGIPPLQITFSLYMDNSIKKSLKSFSLLLTIKIGIMYAGVTFSFTY